MNKPSKIITLVALTAAVVVVGIALGWIGSKGPSASPPVVANATSEIVPAESHPSPPAATPSRKRPRRRTPAGTNQNVAADPTTAGAVTAEWEDKVDQILISEGQDSAKAKEMLELFPRLPEEGQEEVATHLSNLVADEDYASLGKLLTDAKLPESVLDVLMGDALNRPNTMKLPVLLDVARNLQHPKAAEAKDLLELFLDEDYGTDWAKWQAKMDQWLKENPD